MVTLNFSFWKLQRSIITTDKKLPALRIDVTSPYMHSTRKKYAAIHAVAANFEWVSSDTDHWTIETDQFGVQINLVSRAPEELERAIEIANEAVYACNSRSIL